MPDPKSYSPEENQMLMEAIDTQMNALQANMDMQKKKRLAGAGVIVIELTKKKRAYQTLFYKVAAAK